jgi:hypothetical protein
VAPSERARSLSTFGGRSRPVLRRRAELPTCPGKYLRTFPLARAVCVTPAALRAEVALARVRPCVQANPRMTLGAAAVSTALSELFRGSLRAHEPGLGEDLVHGWACAWSLCLAPHSNQGHENGKGPSNPVTANSQGIPSVVLALSDGGLSV